MGPDSARSAPKEEGFVVRLDDGTLIDVRHVRPEDKDLLVRGFAQLSPQSRYRRFFRELDHLSEDQLRYLTEVDFRDHYAWVATLRGAPEETGVGIARWIRLRDDPEIAEAAVTVIDAYQGRGVGKALLYVLASSAIEHGVGAFRAWVLGDNRPMLELLKRLGAEPGRWEAGVYEVTVPLPARIEELDRSPAPFILRATAAGELEAKGRPEVLTPEFRSSE